jgi:hypothetical protein
MTRLPNIKSARSDFSIEVVIVVLRPITIEYGRFICDTVTKNSVYYTQRA